MSINSGRKTIWPRVIFCLVTGCGKKAKGFHTLFGKCFHTPWKKCFDAFPWSRFPYLFGQRFPYPFRPELRRLTRRVRTLTRLLGLSICLPKCVFGCARRGRGFHTPSRTFPVHLLEKFPSSYWAKVSTSLWQAVFGKGFHTPCPCVAQPFAAQP